VNVGEFRWARCERKRERHGAGEEDEVDILEFVFSKRWGAVWGVCKNVMVKGE
jgi:hypothetical protein